MEKEKAGSYRLLWRWHFYAGIIFAPILVMLAITGGIYLFKGEIQNILYKDLYQVEENGSPLTPSEQISIVEDEYPQTKIISFRKGETKKRSTEIEVLKRDGSYIVFINPYSGNILGELKKDEMFMEWVVKLHGELMIGTIGDRIVELAASWAIILLITGLYLWFPRDGKLYGIFKVRYKQGKRLFYRDTHAMLGIWFSAFILLLVLTGLPWAGFMGDKINQVATSTQNGYPTQLWNEVPQSSVPTKEVAEVPWAAENLPVPKSYNLHEQPSLPMEEIISIAEDKDVPVGFKVNFPEGDTGVYTISAFPKNPEDQTTLHINQYTGEILADLRFEDYGWMAKVIEIGIALHEGRYFGVLNQLLALFTCLGLILLVWSGLVMWWKRRPAGKLGAPTTLKSDKISRTLMVLTLLLGVMLPLAGISIIFVLLLEYLLIRRIPAAKEWFAA